MAFTSEISQTNQKKLREAIRGAVEWRNTTLEMTDIANRLNSKLRGWINYYGLYGKRSLRSTFSHIDIRLMKWMRKKYLIGTR